MTEQKILTPQEALRALADGKKLTCNAWLDSTIKFIHLDVETGEITFKDETQYVDDLFNLFEYTEPKPKVVWVEYLATPITKDIQTGGTHFFREGHIPSHELWNYTPTGRKIEV